MRSEYWWLNPFYDGESEPILRDAFEGWEENDGRIFKAIYETTVVPWLSFSITEDNTVRRIEPLDLSIAYFGNHSGGKFCAPLVKHLISDGSVPSSADYVLARTIVLKHALAWKHLWDTFDIDYEPIYNYKVVDTQERKTNGSEGEVKEDSTSSESESTLTLDTNEALTQSASGSQTDSVYGFNSATASPSETSSASSSSTSSNDRTGTETTSAEFSSTNSSDRRKVNAENETIERTREGNIGTTTTQRLLTEERRLWLWSFFETVFNDIDSEIALAFMDPCRV